MKERKEQAEEIILLSEEVPVTAGTAASGAETEETKENEKVTIVSEDKHLRDKMSTVYHTSDGRTQRVIFSRPKYVLNKETGEFVDNEESRFVEDVDGRHFVNDTGEFVARFSRDEEDDELFSVEKDQHKLTFSVKRTGAAKGRKYSCRLRHGGNGENDTVAFVNAGVNTDMEYEVNSCRVKENIVISKPSASYRYQFKLGMTNLDMTVADEEKTIHFSSTETGDEVFCIPAPFMVDAAGEMSDGVFYEVKTARDGGTVLSVIADSEWINSERREFPVTIDPQVTVSGTARISTYSWFDGKMTAAGTHTIATTGAGNAPCNAHRMYMRIKSLSMPENQNIKKAELKIYQSSASSETGKTPRIGLYSVTNGIVTGSCTPVNSIDLMDFAIMKKESADEEGNIISYTFDITAAVDAFAHGQDRYGDFVFKMIEEDDTEANSVTWFGSNSVHSPAIVITYESDLGVSAGASTLTHDLGFFGSGMVDIISGSLKFDMTDFAWNGNRMPVTIRHLYNSRFSDCTYSANAQKGLDTADFSNMKVGNGWKLNLMQSVVAKTFTYDGETFDGYVYMDDTGMPHYLRESSSEEDIVRDEVNNSTYSLYVDAEGGSVTYDNIKRKLVCYGNDYYFNEDGILVSIEDEKGNRITLTYSSGRLTTVTDGAGREFLLDYTEGGLLTSITAPDGSQMCYQYSGNYLETIIYPDGKKVTISRNSYKNTPCNLILFNANGDELYKVHYYFSGTSCHGMIEYGYNNGTAIRGASTAFNYYAAARRAEVTTVEPADGTEEGKETYTVYAFDDDGNITSRYAYSNDLEKTEVTGGTSGINPYSDSMGVVSNVNNLLLDHSFKKLDNWTVETEDSNNFSASAFAYQSYAMFGNTVLKMQSEDECAVENGVFQTTGLLPAGKYCFSAYIRPVTEAEFSDNSSEPGTYLKVTDTDGNLIGESEHIAKIGQGFIRVTLPFTLDNEMAVRVHILMDGKQCSYTDGAQLENNEYANSYNLLTNGNFEKSLEKGWNVSEGAIISTNQCFNMSRSLLLSGNLDSRRYAYQTVPVKTHAGTRESFTLSGWAKANSLPMNKRDGAEDATFRLVARIVYSDDTKEDHVAEFSPCTEEWQLASVSFAKEEFKEITSLDISCEYDYNTGIAYFDDIQLIRTSLETGLSASDFSDETDIYSVFEDGVDLSEDKPIFEEATDEYGNMLTNTQSADGEIGTVYRSYGYNEDTTEDDIDDAGNNLVRETDARGNVITYTVDPETSRRTGMCDRLGNRISYEYTDDGKISKITNKDANETELSHVAYGYDEFGNLRSITRNDGMGYALDYSPFRKLSGIKVSGKTTPLISYTYKNGTGRLKEMTYADGSTVKLTYNAAGKVCAEKWYNADNEQVAYYKYIYDGNGNIVKSIDIFYHREYNYTYTEGMLTRCMESYVDFGADEIIVHRIVLNTIYYVYNKDHQLVRKIIVDSAEREFVITSETDENNGTSVSFKAGGKTVTSHSKTDGFGRKVFDELLTGEGYLNRSFEYLPGAITPEHTENGKIKSNPVTTLVRSVRYSDGREISYEYDAEEKITKVTDSIDGVTEYEYDAQSQLVNETVNGVKTKFVYDSCGNILEKGVCGEDGEIAVETKTVYTYGDSTWKDLLTAVNGQTISYDAGGNPVSYLGHTLTWQKGRQLKSFDSNTYTYNANGIRTAKTVDRTRHDYTIEGVKILREKWGTNTIVPCYDNEGAVCGIIYNDTPYYFVKNLQGDVIAITDTTGAVVARYSYDAWGVPTTVSDTTEIGIADINPYRYRSYYYDPEIGMYYLQSRYYDPALSRFINADEASYAATQGHNLFAYCGNEPVDNEDKFGYCRCRPCKCKPISSIDMKDLGKRKWLAKFISYFAPTLKIEDTVNIFKPIDFAGIKIALQAFTGTSSKCSDFFTYDGKDLVCNIGSVSFTSNATTITTRGVVLGDTTTKAFVTYDARDMGYGLSATTSTKVNNNRVYFGVKFAFSISYLSILAAIAIVAGICLIVTVLAPLAASIGLAFVELAAGTTAALTAFVTKMVEMFQQIALAPGY